MSKFIENIVGDRNINVDTMSYLQYYNANNNMQNDGCIRLNNGSLEYYNAATGLWNNLPGSNIRISFSPHIQNVLDWAEQKMYEEQNLKRLTEKYPALKQAKDNYELIKVLVSNEQ